MTNLKICKKMQNHPWSRRNVGVCFRKIRPEIGLGKELYFAQIIRLFENVFGILYNKIKHMEYRTIKRYPNERKVIKLQFTYLQRILKRQPL